MRQLSVPFRQGTEGPAFGLLTPRTRKLGNGAGTDFERNGLISSVIEL